MNVALAPILLLALGGALIVFLRYRKADGTEGTLEELQELTISAQRLASPIGAAAGAIAEGVVRWIMPAAGERYRELFETSGRKHGVPALLLARQAYQESRFRPEIIDGRVRGGVGEVGIMQITPRWHPEIGEEGAKDPARAIDYAAKFMRQLFERFGSWSLALAAYNAGPAAVEKHGGVPPFTITQAYVSEITRDVGLA